MPLPTHEADRRLAVLRDELPTARRAVRDARERYRALAVKNWMDDDKLRPHVLNARYILARARKHARNVKRAIAEAQVTRGLARAKRDSQR